MSGHQRHRERAAYQQYRARMATLDREPESFGSWLAHRYDRQLAGYARAIGQVYPALDPGDTETTRKRED